MRIRASEGRGQATYWSHTKCVCTSLHFTRVLHKDQYTFLNCSKNPGVQVQLIQIHFLSGWNIKTSNFQGHKFQHACCQLKTAWEPRAAVLVPQCADAW